MNDAASGQSGLTQFADSGDREFVGVDFETPADEVQACIRALRDAYSYDEYELIHQKYDYENEHAVTMDVVDDGQTILFQHTLKTVVPDQVAAILTTTDCEVVHSMVSFQDALDTTETILFIAPSEYAANYDIDAIESAYASWRNGAHLDVDIDEDLTWADATSVRNDLLTVALFGGLYVAVRSFESTSVTEGELSTVVDVASLGLYAVFAVLLFGTLMSVSETAKQWLFT